MDLSILKEKLNLEITKKMHEDFDNFVQLFKIYNSHTNLISKQDEKNLFEKHIFDSLCLSRFFEKYHQNPGSKILDIGTGGGFPSIPLSIVYEDFQIFALDSIAKKIGFVELVQKELRLENIHPLCIRAEELPFEFKESFDIVTSRAVAPLNMLLEYAVPFLKTGGYFVSFKSKTAEEEIEAAKNAMNVLNAKVIDRIKYELPHQHEFVRELLVIKKEKPTPQTYPRKSGQAKKNPL